jgi:hypothetical protein
MDQTVRAPRPFLHPWRIAGWGFLLALLCLPAVVMRVAPDSGVNWTASDFIFAAVMFALVGTGIELAFRSGKRVYRAAAAVAVVTSFLLIWVNLAVGIIGSEDNGANWMYVGVLAMGLSGSLVARFEPAGMQRTMTVLAVAQLLTGVIALIGRLGVGDPNWPLDVVGATLMFTALWGTSAALFRLARG